MDNSEAYFSAEDAAADEAGGMGTVLLSLLDHAIQKNPGAPVNYLLRGEEWLLLGEWDRARAAFETARDLAEDLLRQSAWGYVYQAYVDRVDAALRELESLSARRADEPGN